MNRAVRVGVLALGAYNRRSVCTALERAGATVSIVGDAAAAERVDALVLPGVANFGYVAQSLDALGLRDVTLAAIRTGLPTLGICVGYQLLFAGSDEAPDFAGLGVLSGVVRRLRGPKRQHVGWNRVVPIDGDGSDGWAYFAHAFAPEADIDGARASTTFGERFTSVVRVGSVTGMQFHPECSGAYGAALLRTFVARVRCARAS
jgi:imidazole glycerol-phosphate synthase subunit HisH